MVRPFAPETLLRRPLMATLATLAADGAPCTAPMWYIWEDGALWLLGSSGSSTVARLTGDGRCSVEIVDFDRAAGVLLHLGLRGTATVVAMQPDRFRRLLALYLGDPAGWNPWFIDNIAQIDAPEGRLIRLAPDSVFTNNVSYFRSGPDLAWP